MALSSGVLPVSEATPPIAIRVSAEEKEKIDLIAKLSGRSKRSLFQEALLGIAHSKIDELKNAQNEGYEEGFQAAKEKYEIWYFCSKCGEQMTMYPDDKDHKKMSGYMKV